jgi:hypothetical protein
MAKQQAKSSEQHDGDGRPATQVLSTRVSVAIAEEVAARASALGVRPADFVRQAVEAYMRNPGVAGLRANGEGNLKLASDDEGYATQNANPVTGPAEITTDPPDVVALGF